MKVINDPVHNHVQLTPIAVSLMNTQEFQRLRRIQQMGFGSYVFPGAEHSRFQHCIGTAYLARSFGEHLLNQSQEYDTRDSEFILNALELAGMSHDLGHGPKSHLFESFTSHIGIPFNHEDMSCKIFDLAVNNNGIEISEDMLNCVKSLIKGEITSSIPAFAQSIVKNCKNGIDVDKFDYLQRDSLHTGINISCQFDRLMYYTKPIGDDICFKKSEACNIVELFHSRASMHQRVYKHKTINAIDIMAIEELQKVFNTPIDRPEDFVRLDDRTIENKLPWLMKNIEERRLFKCAAEIATNEDERIPTEEEIASYGENITPNEIIIHKTQVNWGNTCSLEKVPAFSKHSDVIEKLHTDDLGVRIPQSFIQQKIRIFVRNPKILNEVQNAVKKLYGGTNKVQDDCID